MVQRKRNEIHCESAVTFVQNSNTKDFSRIFHRSYVVCTILYIINIYFIQLLECFLCAVNAEVNVKVSFVYFNAIVLNENV